MKNNTNSIFDLLKLILAIMVVCIHCQILPSILFPWVRIAVPLFFVISSYFLFSKLKVVKEKEKKYVVKKYVIRNIKLYLFYAILLLPLILYHRNYFYDKSVVKGFLRIIRSVLFSSTFIASWYIMASIIGTIIIYKLSKRFSNKYLFIISLVIYLLITLRSSYMFAINNKFILKIINMYELLFTASYNSFPVSLIWIVIGKIFAEKKIENNYTYKIVSVIAVIGLFVEHYLVKLKSGSINNDCYIMLVPSVILIFIQITNAKMITIKNSVKIRNFSTILYALHGTIHAVIAVIFKSIGVINQNIFIFILTMFLCYIIFLVEQKFENIKYFKWLKYSH